MKKLKYLGLIMIIAFMLTGCGEKDSTSGGIDNGSNKKVSYYTNAETIYFNAETGKVCSDYKEENSKVENTKGCLKWYLYSDNGNKTVNLLLDHNITQKMIWTEKREYKNGPNSEFLDTLKNKTQDWKGVKDRTDKYSLKDGEIDYTIDYTGYKARIISQEEIMNIIKDTYSNGEDNNMIYFNKSTCSNKDYSSKCEFGWLFDRTGSSCKSVGCYNDGGDEYWTSTAYLDDKYSPVWAVKSNGVIRHETVGFKDTGKGIRPVITIDKSIIK